MQEADVLGGGLRSFPVLRGSRGCDVLIIGGGFSGVLTAYMAAEAGLRVCVAEAHRFGSGASSACMGVITAQLGERYQAAADISGEAASAWARMTWQSVRRAEKLIARLQPSIHAYRHRNAVYAVTGAEGALLEALVSLEQSLRLPVAFTEDTGDCPVPVRMAATMEEQLLVDSGMLFHALIEAALQRGVVMYEYSPVRALKKGVAMTENGSVTASHIILATGWPIGMHDSAQMNALSQQSWLVSRLSGGSVCHGTYLHIGSGDAFAPSQYGLLAATPLGTVGLKLTERNTARAQQNQTKQLQDWSALHETVQQCVHTVGGLPMVGSLERNEPGLMAVSGCGAYGFAQSLVAAELLVSRILGKPLAESALFEPTGSFHHHAAQKAARRNERLRQMANIARRSRPVCTHMGCRMRWNATRGLWECPCHGSTFTDSGACCCGPAMRDASVPEHLRHPW